MGSRTFDGVRFSAFSLDHDPPHVHGYYADVQAIVDLDEQGRKARLADRERNPLPRNAKRSHVNHILKSAADHIDELLELWRNA